MSNQLYTPEQGAKDPIKSRLEQLGFSVMLIDTAFAAAFPETISVRDVALGQTVQVESNEAPAKQTFATETQESIAAQARDALKSVATPTAEIAERFKNAHLN